jgi:hypothetical protein
MADSRISGLDEYEGTGPVPAGALFIVYNPLTGLDRRLPASRLPVAAPAPAITAAALFALLVAEPGIEITLQGDKVHIASTIIAASPAGQPEPPTEGVVDDIGDTWSFKPTAAYPSFSQLKIAGLPGVTGAVYLDATNSYVQGGRIYVKVVGAVPTGGLAVYVAGSGSIPDGRPLLNNAPFTGTAPTGGTVTGTGSIGSDSLVITSAIAS